MPKSYDDRSMVILILVRITTLNNVKEMWEMQWTSHIVLQILPHQSSIGQRDNRGLIGAQPQTRFFQRQLLM
jgi:hypothetical protein